MITKKLVFSIIGIFFYVMSIAQNSGSSYCGPYISSPPMLLEGIKDSTISSLEISNQEGNCITLVGCSNIVIKQCKLKASSGNGIDIYNCDGVFITDCRMESVATGVYALESSKIQVVNISVRNVVGPLPRGQMVQFDKVSGGGNRINYNVAENVMGESNPEDIINLYKSKGTLNDPIQIIGNWIRGGGPSKSGGGIMTGDNGGGNVLVMDNILVDPGQYGIAIAGGENIQLLNNSIFAKRQAFTNVGIYVWNQHFSPCSNLTVSKNKVNWTNSRGSSNDAWNGDNCGAISGWNNNSWGAKIGPNILPETILGVTGVDIQTACNSYTWIDGEMYTSNNNTATFTLPNKNGCDSIVTLNLTINTVNTVVVINGTEMSSDAVGANYQWLDCSKDMQVINGETNKSYSPVESGSYAVEVTQNNCIDTSACKSVTLTDVVNYGLKNSFVYYSSPINNNLVLEFDEVQEKLTVQLFSVTGRCIQQKQFQDTDNIQFELNQPKGVYLVKVLKTRDEIAVFPWVR